MLGKGSQEKDSEKGKEPGKGNEARKCKWGKE